MEVISRSRWGVRGLAALALALLFSLSSVIAAFASGGGILQISSDPYTNNSSQHQTEVEPDTFSFGSTIVSTFQAGRFFNGGSSNVGWATSIDNGVTWTHGFLPRTTVFATPPGPYARATDPAVAYDVAHKTWMIVVLVLDTNGVGAAVLVSRSSDGLTWKRPVTVKKAVGSDFFDKTWIACDETATSPFFGHCYVEYDNHGLGNLIQMSTSSDGGATWGAPKTTGNSATGLGGQPLIQPGGKVIVPIDDAFESSLLAFTSSDGGATWSNTVSVTTLSTSFVNGGLRAPDLISADMDKSGKVYVVWYDCRFESGCSANDIVMSTSKDGVTWSAAKRIPIDGVGSGVDHFLAGIGIDHATTGKHAHIGLIFYFYPVANCNSSTCQLEVGFVSSIDGGHTWSAKITLTPAMNNTWLANTNQGFMVGDYFSTSFANGRSFPVFAVATAPTGGVFNEAMFTASGGLAVTGGTLSSDGDSVLASHPVPSILRSAN